MPLNIVEMLTYIHPLKVANCHFFLSVLSSGLLHPAAGQVHPETTTEGCRSSRRSQRSVCRRAQPCGPQGTEEGSCTWRVSKSGIINSFDPTLNPWRLLDWSTTVLMCAAWIWMLGSMSLHQRANLRMSSPELFLPRRSPNTRGHVTRKWTRRSWPG